MDKNYINKALNKANNTLEKSKCTLRKFSLVSIVRLVTLVILFFFTSILCRSQEFQFLNVFLEGQIYDHAIEELEIEPLLAELFTHDVRMYRASYEMPFQGSQINVSGAIFTPLSSNPQDEFPIVVFNHGTTFVRTSVPSFNDEITNMGYLLSSLGFIVLMPDYVGLGESQIMHPYCHAQSESECGWNLVKAFVDSFSEFEIHTNGNLFITGYSQGGHVAMAMAMNDMPESIEEDLNLIAVAPLSGPYDMSGVQLPMTFQEISYSNPAYLFYILKGWNSVYGNIYEEFSEICNEPYASIIESMLDGFHSAEEINAECPEELIDLFPENLIQEVLSNPDHIIMQHASDNDVYNWVPTMPVHMRYCTQDEEVFYQNALSASSWMIENGAEDIIAYNVGDANHNDCALSAITNSMLWFYSLNSSGITSVEEDVFIQGSECLIYDLYGRVVYEGHVEQIQKLNGIFIIKYSPMSKPKKIFISN
ncbi:MAG: hypothetical protein CL850_02320 [Crocinitomicaceae bacterium]|nr:hypothetical protein [Crocinitomicaceae bacterium]